MAVQYLSGKLPQAQDGGDVIPHGPQEVTTPGGTSSGLNIFGMVHQLMEHIREMGNDDNDNVLNIEDILAYLQMLEESAGGASAAILPYQAVMPPALEMLSEMRTRRETKRSSDLERLATLATLISQNLPANLEYYPGFEPGGLHDFIMRRLGGEAGHGEKVLPIAQRKVQRTAIPIPQEVAEPTVTEEFEEAQRLAEILTDAIRMLEAGKVVGI